MVTVLLVAAGGATGALGRYLLDRWVRQRHDSPFPWGTLLVNVLGSLLLGLLLGLASRGAVPPWAVLLAGTGLCGALTTVSTFAYDTAALVADHRPALATANVLGSATLCLAAAAVGLALTG
ncbi:fluoride efflux transporter CrcB [Ornithinicoccus halotolerans]|uniref:fluoride efflux transporter CrcB n=1 Tax=Ornithinicoccus halotolerans TaxID=1748220 RepID=UPI001E5D2E4B|nr:fluoride efflux transporter CrcB [Ornithinicoccus halotolerans]